MKHESIGIPLGLGQKVEVLTLPKSVPEWTGDRIQTNAKGQMRTNFVENEEAVVRSGGVDPLHFHDFRDWREAKPDSVGDVFHRLFRFSEFLGVVLDSRDTKKAFACVPGKSVREFSSLNEAKDWLEREVS